MAGSTYMTVAGLLYAFIAAMLLSRSFFSVVSNLGTAEAPGDPARTTRVRNNLMDAAIAMPMLAVGFAALGFGLLTKGGLNGVGVMLMVALGAGLLYYAGVKDMLLEALADRKQPVRELPPPAVLLPQPEPAAERRPAEAAKAETVVTAEAAKPITNPKLVTIPRKTG